MCQIDGIGSSGFGRHRVLLGQHQPHDLAELDVLQEELDVDRVASIVVVRIAFIFDEIFFSYHFDIRVVSIDRHGSTQGDRDRAVSCEQRPPDAFPKTFVLPAQLRVFDTVGRDQSMPVKVPLQLTFYACRHLEQPQ
jgi:hypothetical protein